ncbi:hypothetical protein ACFLZG_07235, partial [Thermodesulfobacteriota bacterium]
FIYLSNNSGEICNNYFSKLISIFLQTQNSQKMGAFPIKSLTQNCAEIGEAPILLITNVTEAPGFINEI